MGLDAIRVTGQVNHLSARFSPSRDSDRLEVAVGKSSRSDSRDTVVSTLRLILVIAALALVHSSALPQEARHALLIGADQYRKVPVLRNGVNDATAMEQALKSVGFRTTVVADPTRRELADAIRQFAKQAEGAHAVVVVSGHVVQAQGTNS